MTTAVREAPHHNTLTCVKHYGCNRLECRDRLNAYYRAWRRTRKSPLLIDAEPVRQHLELLAEAGIGAHRISTLTGLAEETIAGFTRPYGSGDGRRYGRKRQVHPDVAAKILAIDPVTTTPGVVNAIGSRRRIQALNAAGWPTAVLATRLPLGRATLLTLPRQTHLQARTADAIAALYDELKTQQPEKHGVLPRSITKARLRAERANWPGHRYWATRMDVIDDPHFEPMYGVTRREIVAQDAAWVMRTTGLDKTATAARLGIHKSYLDHAFREHPQYAVEQAA